jgi:hypothetical protein
MGRATAAQLPEHDDGQIFAESCPPQGPTLRAVSLVTQLPPLSRKCDRRELDKVRNLGDKSARRERI